MQRPLPLLSLAAVIQVTAFEEPFARVALNELGMRGTMQFFPSIMSLEMEVLIEGLPYKRATTVGFAKDRYKTTPYFICPVCSKRCTLLIPDRQLMCTEDYIRCGTGSSQRWRAERLKEGRAALKEVTRPRRTRWLPREDWERGERFDDRYRSAIAAAAVATAPTAIEVQPKPARPSQPESEYSTLRALSLGRNQKHSELYRAYCESAFELIDRLDQRRSPLARPGTPAALATTPVLDITVLQDNRCWPEGDDRTARTLCWPGNDDGILLIIDLGWQTPTILVAHRWRDLSDPGWQFLPVELAPSGQPRFLCPAEGWTCEKLYLRDGRFASRQAHRLYHESQRGAARSRARKRSAAAEQAAEAALRERRRQLLADLTALMEGLTDEQKELVLSELDLVLARASGRTPER